MTVNNDATAGRPRPYRFLHCDWLSWLQPRRKMNMFISGCSHITVIIAKNAFVRQPISPYRLDIYCLFASPLSSLNEHIRSYLLHTWQSQMNWPTLALKVYTRIPFQSQLTLYAGRVAAHVATSARC